MSNSQKPRVDEDDDLDDLDDVIDQFSSPAQPNIIPTLPAAAAVVDTSTSTEGEQRDFETQLAEALMKELGIEEGEGTAGQEQLTDQQQRLAAAWEAMLTEGMGQNSDLSTSSPGAGKGGFQSTIRSTMNQRMQRESNLNSSNQPANPGGDSLEALLSRLGDLGGLSGEGAESEEQLEGVLEEMMSQLMSKDVLYEPLKELHDKFPAYLTEHSSRISPDDQTRYEAQISCIKRLIDEFEANTYREDDVDAHKKIVALMEELQTHGSPPEEIVGPLPPGLNMGSDGLPNLPDGCNSQ